MISERSRLSERRISMPTDRESNEIKKSMAYDLIDIIESSEGKESYTPEEIKALIKAYITGMSQK
jgi:hypothetical protein